MKRLILAFAAIAAASAFADRVVMKSGSVLTGSGAVIAGDKVKFTSDDLGDVELPADKVAFVETAEEKKVEVSALPLEEKPPETWHGSINVAYESARGNTYKNNASIIANLNRRWDNDRVNFDFGYYYSETGTSKDTREKSTDRWEIEGQHDHFWSKAFYTYENGRYEQDDIAGLDFRLRLGGGLGYQWFEKDALWSIGTLSFNQELGAAWIRVDYKEKDPDAEKSYATLRYAHHLKYFPKWNPDIETFHNLEFLPQIDDFDNHLIKADVGITTKIIMDFDLLAKIEWDYNSVPSVGRKSSDFRYIVGLGYKW